MSDELILCTDPLAAPLPGVLGRFGLEIQWVDRSESIPGSFWGDSEAGLVGNRLYLRDDTPLHSALHEACHYVCMDDARRQDLDTDAGGDYAEENGVCYLQILLADQFPGVGRTRLQQDMDAWGYSFRLGSAAAWFEHDAQDAFEWLLHHQIVDNAGRPTWVLRETNPVATKFG